MGLKYQGPETWMAGRLSRRREVCGADTSRQSTWLKWLSLIKLREKPCLDSLSCSSYVPGSHFGMLLLSQQTHPWPHSKDFRNAVLKHWLSLESYRNQDDYPLISRDLHIRDANCLLFLCISHVSIEDNADRRPKALHAWPLHTDYSQAAFSLCIVPADIDSGLQCQAMTYSECLDCQPTMVPDVQVFFC